MKYKPLFVQQVLPGLERFMATGIRSARDVTKDAFREIEIIFDRWSDTPPRGLPLGFAELDRWITGLRRADLTVVASRPGVGKTLFSLHVAFNAANKHTAPVLIFTPDAKRTNTVLRILSFVGKIAANSMVVGNFEGDDWPKLVVAAGRLSDAPVFIDDSPVITPDLIKLKGLRVQERAGLGLIVVDGLESVRMSGTAPDSEYDHLERARSLKCIARTLDVPLILTANIDRRVEDRTDGRPELTDLQNRHAEVFADLILLLHREKMALHTDGHKYDRELLDVNIAKNRNGPTGRVRLILDKQFLRLTDSGAAVT